MSAVTEKRMSELTPGERTEAREAWLRNNVAYTNEDIAFLLGRLDDARIRIDHLERVRALSEPPSEGSGQ